MQNIIPITLLDDPSRKRIGRKAMPKSRLLCLKQAQAASNRQSGTAQDLITNAHGALSSRL